MNILHGRIAPALLAFAGLVAVLESSSAASSRSFERRTDVRTVPIAGTLAGKTEDIDIKGVARVISTAFVDDDPGAPPGVFLLIDFIEATGVGQQSGTLFLVHGENQVLRLLIPTDVVELTFPISPANARKSAATESVLATFQLTYNVGQGQLIAASASFSTPGL
ncbi:hypothetical protein ID144_23470 [Pseudomonas sp. JM0905a]|uniref:hypothetical protein n=1 Tax=Pseudomonas sp. JM0905a TaxID=2772484 RepID=UPI001683AF91|nr:hypothetical protein [Pseudomonas sp. JM0905a]MBD2840008.1 hypothetical protein [Pseudomonas sp. JM0905a]